MTGGCAPAIKPDAGRIVFGMTWEPVSFFPLRLLDSASYYAQTLVYEGLVKYDYALNIVPGLAESFQLSSDRLTYTFHLRPGLKFSSGEPIRLKDVTASILLAADKQSPYHADYQDIAEVLTPAPDTLVLKLARPCDPLMSRLVELRVLPESVASMPDRGRKLLSRHPICSGPFCLTSWESGSELVFQPNPHYWGNKPAYKELVWRVVPDRSLIGLALKSGELDVAQIDAGSWTFLSRKGDRQLSLARFPGSRTVYLGFNLQKAPFDRHSVRQAISMAIDRQALARDLYRGYAAIARSDFPPSAWTFDPAAMLWPFDATGAKEQLKQGGFRFEGKSWQGPEGQLSFPIVTVKDYQDVAETISAELWKVGIPNGVRVVEFSTLRARYLKTGNFTAVIFSRSVGPDPECFLVWSSKGPLNFSKYANSTLDGLLLSGRSAPSREARKKVYQQVQQILAREVPWVFLVHPELLIAHAPQIEGIKLPGQEASGLPWDNPLFNAASWRKR